jgi:hypothetical protein
MTSIEKTTVPIGKVAVIMIFFGGVIANYYTTLNAVKDGISELKNETTLEINNLKNEQNNIRKELTELKISNKEIKDAAMSYIGTAMKPEEPEEVKRRKYKQGK